MWWFIAIFVVTLVLGSLTPKTSQTQKPAGLSEIDSPQATEGLEIAVLFGTRDMPGINCLWYGDLKTVAIKSKGGKK